MQTMADVRLPPDDEFAEAYHEACGTGRTLAQYATVAMVAICRNAMPFLPQTLELVEKTGEMFANFSVYIHENDSSDGTKDVLSAWSDGERRHASLNDHGRPHLNHTTAPERTHALAEYRNACRQFVENGKTPDYVIVFDTDPWGGWSLDGIATSVYYMRHVVGVQIDGRPWDGLASYSWAQTRTSQGVLPIHYDAFAARLNHWKQRDQQWFHHWHPPVGSPPVEFRSAFGQLAIYDARSYLRGRYRGEDCEHVLFHRSIGGRIGLNPSSRCISFWVPDGGNHGND